MVRERRPGTGRDRAAGRNLRQTVDGNWPIDEEFGVLAQTDRGRRVDEFVALDLSREG